MGARKNRKPTKLMREFVRQYLLLRNGVKAMEAAGYKSKNADVDASRLLQQPWVAAQIAVGIEAVEKEAQQKFEISRDRVLQELAKVAFDDEQEWDIGDMMDWDESSVTMIPKDKMDRKIRRQIKSLKEVIAKDGSRGIQLEVKNYDKVKALKLLGDHIGLWRNKNDDDGNKPASREDARRASISRLSELLRKAGK